MITIGENTPYTNIELPRDWSYHPIENEVLLLPNFHFTVKKIEEDENFSYVYI